MRKVWLIIIPLSAALAIRLLPAHYSSLASQPAARPPAPGFHYVIRDIDGDTIDVDMGTKVERVRLIGVDTPETHKPNTPVQCFGPEAANETAKLVEHKYVRLQSDPEDSDRDKYGRLLRYVYLPDGSLLNAELVKNGYGFAYKVFKFTDKNQFVQLEQQARSSKAGLWGACQVDTSHLIEQTTGSSN